MSAEKSGFSIKVTCTQDPEIVFSCKTKKRPGVRLGNKIDMTTDSTIESHSYEPADLLEVTDGELTVLDDPVNANKIITILGKKGTIFFTGKISGTCISYPNSWFASYIPNEMKLDSSPPTASIIIQSDGTLPCNSALTAEFCPGSESNSIPETELINAFLAE